jgi:predicted nucleic acid-binding protein
VIVLDSSAAVDYLLPNEPAASWVAGQLARAGPAHAPHLLDLEVLSAVRRLVGLHRLSATYATGVLGDLVRLDVVRYPHVPLLERMWQLRHNVSAYDAAFVSLAEALDAPLVTTDSRLAAASGHRARVVSP